MNGFDILIVIILALGAWRGWANGFLKEVFSLIGVFIGLFIAYMFYEQVGFHIAPYINLRPTYSKLVAFALIFIVIPVLLGWLGSMMTKFLEWVGLESVNSLGGALVCIIKYAIVLGVICNVLSITGLVSEESEHGSLLYTPLKETTSKVFEVAKHQWKVSTDPDCDE